LKIKRHIFLLCSITLGFLALISCVAPVATATPQLSATFSPTFVPSPSLTPTPSRTLIPEPPTPTFEPTLPAAQEQHINELLQDENCNLPCYLGITPGKTTLNEARTILENLGAGYWGKPYTGRKDGAIGYTYTFMISGQPGVGETPRPDGSIRTVSGDVILVTDNDIVQIIDANAGTIGPGTSTTQGREKFRKYWQRYTAREIFMQMGPPDQLYLDIIESGWLFYGRTLFMVYEKRGVVAELYGTGKENNICPENEARFLSLGLMLYNPNSNLSIYPNGRTSQDLGLPIDEVLGVSTQEFYQRVIADPSACFMPKTSGS